MSNNLSVSIYIKREDILKLLEDESLTHIHVEGNIEVLDETRCAWNIVATGYPSKLEEAVFKTCPRPCP